MSDLEVLERAIMDLVGEPRGHWIGDNTWIPPEGQPHLTPDQLRDIFANECTLFVGDSLQRRAADTLHLMIQQEEPEADHNSTFNNTSTDSVHTPIIQDSVFTDEYFKQKKHDRGFRKRNIGSQNNTASVRRGCIDTDWRPTLADVQQFAQDFAETNKTWYQDYTVVIIGSTIWEVVGSSQRRTSAMEIRGLINTTIQILYETLPSHVRILWKTSGWCEDCPWIPDEARLSRGDNYKVYAANEAAIQTVQSLNDTQRIAIADFAREILPRSLRDHRLRPNDRTTLHYGLVPRLVTLQLIAFQLEQWQQPQELSSQDIATPSPTSSPTPVPTSPRPTPEPTSSPTTSTMGFPLQPTKLPHLLNVVFVTILLFIVLRRRRHPISQL